MLPLSFEFFPPKTAEQRETLEHTAQRLKPLAPDYVSCTFGAGGSTLSYTYDTVVALKQHGLDVAPHLSCMGGTARGSTRTAGTLRGAGLPTHRRAAR
jgi:methylenetetrahydrofolate reductase (NADPH)